MIIDPKKRDLIVSEFLKTKKYIQEHQLEERLGEQEAFSALTKQFKPTINAQKATIGEIKSIREGIQNLPRFL